jgi:hypothetical protein
LVNKFKDGIENGDGWEKSSRELQVGEKTEIASKTSFGTESSDVGGGKHRSVESKLRFRSFDNRLAKAGLT